MERWWNKSDMGKLKHTNKGLSQCYFVCQIST